MVVKNNGGSCREIGMIEVAHKIRKMKSKYYCYGCVKEIIGKLLEEV